ncbi:hypothetical protein CHL67_08355 [Prosthecochloris sp. GSB1]|uniref:aldehyde dehydrogenase family protein n=1 Tax=Prosthecochloris sp. GSB1 TaxID=281093 RepID=UPI000B8CD295|nr:aldehyde dehydrogenase family protein [Prosthecochloris sp. GSB1]ASQ90927.1 hypothetical protein CHL67_08355 [Prosthecochloris sp. GSB1]
MDYWTGLFHRWRDVFMSFQNDRFSLLVGGDSVVANNSFAVINPATEEEVGYAPAASLEHVDKSVLAYEEVRETWTKDIAYRRKLLQNCARKIEAQTDSIAEILSSEHGKPLHKSKLEISGVVKWFMDTSLLAIPDTVNDKLPNVPNVSSKITRKPYGVVAAITPWNFPLMMMAWKVAPALLMGNGVIVKPSPFTPLSSLYIGKIMSEVLPRGTLSVLTGDNRFSHELCSHARIKKISLTGSIETGKSIYNSSGLKDLTLELGGNDPAIILPDADIESCIEEIFWAAFSNCGQICTGIKRLYIHESMFERTANLLREYANNVKIGGAFESNIEMGPINNAQQLYRIESMVFDAVESGGICISGGRRLDRKGYFYPPTIITNIRDDSRVVNEEQFGPVLPLLTYTSLDNAVIRANNSNYGLGGSVWGRDVSLAERIAEKLECGTAWINMHGPIWGAAPFGGWKLSGIGEEHGEQGLYEYSQAHVVYKKTTGDFYEQ